MTDQPKRSAETIRGQVLTYLSHLDGAEVSLTDLSQAVEVWHLQLSQILRPLIRRGRVLVRTVDGRARYRFGAPDGPGAHGTNDLAARLALLEQRLADVEGRLEAIGLRELCSNVGHARDNQDRCHRCGVHLGEDAGPSPPCWCVVPAAPHPGCPLHAEPNPPPPRWPPSDRSDDCK